MYLWIKGIYWCIRWKTISYKDRSGLECDAVINLRNGSYGLIEIKLGTNDAIEEVATNLKKLKDMIDTTKMEDPSFLMVLIGVGKSAYLREDGVYVVPIGCLKDQWETLIKIKILSNENA